MSYLESLFNLNGKVAVVTGASRGIGAAIAAGLSEAQARVYCLSRSEPREKNETLNFRPCDVGDRSALVAVLDEVHRDAGRIDVLINAAGVTFPVPAEDRAAAEDEEYFRKTMSVNVDGAFHAIRKVSSFMKEQGGGSIVNVTSIAAVVGMPGNPAYVASKGALQQLTRACALDLAPHYIRVNNLAPGYIKTDMTRGSYNDPQKNAARLKHMMLPRWGEPGDLVGAAIFLASDASAYVTGTDLMVDGGWTAKGLQE